MSLSTIEFTDDEENKSEGNAALTGTADNKNEDESDKSSASDDKSGSHGEKPKKNSALRELLSWLEVLVIAVLAALFINSFIIANSTVPTGSMENTISEGARVIGLRLSYTFGEPERGDIAIFKFGWICNHCNQAQGEGAAPEVCPNCGKELTHPKTLYYLKRVIGMPGDKIEIRQEGTVKQGEISGLSGLDSSKGDDAELITAAVYINGERIEEDYLKEPMLYTGDMEFTVPDGCYFMMGDNRNNSLDARYWNNPYIEKEKIIAKVILRYYPGISVVK